MESELIELVRAHPCLYDTKSKHYRDQSMRQQSWEEIAQEMNSTVETMKLMWVKLRNAFMSAKRRRKGKSGQSSRKMTPWKFEKELSYLAPFLDMRETQTNLEKAGDLDNSIDESQSFLEEGVEEESTVSAENVESFTPLVEKEEPRKISSSSFEKRAASKARNNPAQQMIEIMRENSKQRAKRADEKSRMTDLDETDLFYLSMAKTVKKLPQIEQTKLRMKICQLVSEAEISHIERSNSSSLANLYSENSSFPSSSSVLTPVSQTGLDQPASPSALYSQYQFHQFP